MFHCDIQKNGSTCHHYTVKQANITLDFNSALDLWQHDIDFTCFCLDLLKQSPFAAYRWEMPPLTRENLNRDFEFVLLDSPGLQKPADRNTFESHFAMAESGICVFQNLGKDATLIVPAPIEDRAYAHLAAFIRQAPEAQAIQLFKAISQAMSQRLSDKPVWLNTAGAGVAWLHIRLDDRPKYYRHQPYKTEMKSLAKGPGIQKLIRKRQPPKQ